MTPLICPTLKRRLNFQMAALLAVTFLAAGDLTADPSSVVGEPIPLWAGEVPGEKGDVAAEKTIERGDGLVRLTNVTQATITLYRPGKGIENSGAAVLVCPGGGYNILAMSHEGTEVCKWLNQLGITAVLLKYRVPRRKGLDKSQAPLQDAQRAMSLVRKRAGEWGIDPKKIGILGFSAGGHLATMVLSQYDKPRTYPQDAEIDSVSSRPDFAVLVYAAYIQDEKNPDKLASGIAVNKNTPPVFLVAAHNDKAWGEGSAHLYIALKRAGVPTELHIFAKGGHGFGMKKTDDRVAKWPEICAQWLGELGIGN
ncbi:MAG: alpha/beta hydrolase [Verrucomicrobiota bacterium]